MVLKNPSEIITSRTFAGDGKRGEKVSHKIHGTRARKTNKQKKGMVGKAERKRRTFCKNRYF